ncbi:MAG: L-glutamate gamma-semialdehyde dehydrogenase, partial [Alphaproteobacteria bacterium]|nr:L-glutamate gamma-semialdehyde dehydrogenase [Alphaproteobacteria bacterium]
AVQALARQSSCVLYEFQRLHGLGEQLHDMAMQDHSQQCRIYAPVGAHNDLLAYLARRLLENGANSSFIHQLNDPETTIEALIADPARLSQPVSPAAIRLGHQIYPDRCNARGIDLDDPVQLKRLLQQRAAFAEHQWQLYFCSSTAQSAVTIRNPARPEDCLAEVGYHHSVDFQGIITEMRIAAKDWHLRSPTDRVQIIMAYSDLLEMHTPEILALLCREAGKTLKDSLVEVREAVDFCRYYSTEVHARHRAGDAVARGVVLCISPWNFPLAIFTGQLVAALVTGNAVIAKPAEETPVIADFAVRLLHQAGVPENVLRLMLLEGAETSGSLIARGLVDMVCFTGSIAAAQAIHHAIAYSSRPEIPLIAETGGINAMMVDATALIERVVDDVLVSAFQSAGQRCSALRLLCVQQDCADTLINALIGAAKRLTIGDPWWVENDIGPIIHAEAKQDIEQYLLAHRGQILWQAKPLPLVGNYVAPTIIELEDIFEIQREVFAPIVHVVRFEASKVDTVIADINALGYGLTFGLQGRMYHAQERISQKISVGNVYINRDQIGAIVGAQPFGGMGLSGTGPKAGGPMYLSAFMRNKFPICILARKMPGVDGEENLYTTYPRGIFAVLESDDPFLSEMVGFTERVGNTVIKFERNSFQDIKFEEFSGIILPPSETELIAETRRSLSVLSGAICPLITDSGQLVCAVHEKLICRNTAAAGGNVALLMNTS